MRTGMTVAVGSRVVDVVVADEVDAASAGLVVVVAVAVVAAVGAVVAAVSAAAVVAAVVDAVAAAPGHGVVVA